MNWTVSRRIAYGFAVILGLTVLVATAGILALRSTAAAYRDALAEERAVVQTALRAEASAGEANIFYLRYLVQPDPDFARRRDSASTAARRRLEEVRAAARGETRAHFVEALRRLQEWDEATTASMRAAEGQRQDERVSSWEARVLPASLAMRDAINSGVAEARTLGDAAVLAAERAAGRMQWLMLIAGLAALGLGTLYAWLLNRAVTAPLRETTGVLASSAAEILAATTQQASGASETSAAVAETSTTVDEVAQTAEHAAERARAVAESARRAAEIGKSGRRAVEESIAAMDGVKEQVQSIAESILALAERAQAIGEIISTVNDVAEQTHLLALNAAVEAARAGEHGRGFAVVASEVRGLAEESKRATVQVRQILGEIQRATNAAVMTTERGSNEAAAGVRQVHAAGETIRELADAAAEAAQAAAQIVASAGEQAAGMSQIRHAMASVQEATHQTLASTRQAEGAAQDLNRLGARLLDLVGAERRPVRRAVRV